MGGTSCLGATFINLAQAKPTNVNVKLSRAFINIAPISNMKNYIYWAATIAQTSCPVLGPSDDPLCTLLDPPKPSEVPQSSHYLSKKSSKVPNQVSFAQPVQPYLHLVPSLSCSHWLRVGVNSTRDDMHNWRINTDSSQTIPGPSGPGPPFLDAFAAFITTNKPTLTANPLSLRHSSVDTHLGPTHAFGGGKDCLDSQISVRQKINYNEPHQLNYHPYSNYWPCCRRCWIYLLEEHQ